MTGEHQAIVTAFEQEGMTIEQIAQDRSLDITSVKACLMQFSPAYKKACNALPEDESYLNFSNEQLNMANQVIAQTMFEDDPNLAFKAATYVRNDKKGRLEPSKMIGNTFNIMAFNEKLEGLKSRAKELKDRVVDVELQVSNGH